MNPLRIELFGETKYVFAVHIIHRLKKFQLLNSSLHRDYLWRNMAPGRLPPGIQKLHKGLSMKDPALHDMNRSHCLYQ